MLSNCTFDSSLSRALNIITLENSKGKSHIYAHSLTYEQTVINPSIPLSVHIKLQRKKANNTKHTLLSFDFGRSCEKNYERRRRRLLTLCQKNLLSL